MTIAAIPPARMAIGPHHHLLRSTHRPRSPRLASPRHQDRPIRPRTKVRNWPIPSSPALSLSMGRQSSPSQSRGSQATAIHGAPPCAPSSLTHDSREEPWRLHLPPSATAAHLGHPVVAAPLLSSLWWWRRRGALHQPTSAKPVWGKQRGEDAVTSCP